MAETEGVVDVAGVVESVDHEETVDAPAPAPVPETTQAIDLDELVGSGGSGVPPGVDSLSAPLDEDAFIDAYTPLAPVEAAAVEPKEEDPRVAWRKKNQDALRAKDVEEAKTKKANAEKAQAHLKKVQEARTKSLSARKETNRNTQKGLSPESGVPKEGTAWEKVNGLVNFSQGTHAKDVTRFKTTLISLKAVKA